MEDGNVEVSKMESSKLEGSEPGLGKHCLGLPSEKSRTGSPPEATGAKRRSAPPGGRHPEGSGVPATGAKRRSAGRTRPHARVEYVKGLKILEGFEVRGEGVPVRAHRSITPLTLGACIKV